MMTKEQATKLANDVVKQIGAPWKPYVWENLGWCASAEFEGGYLHGGGGGLTLYIVMHGKSRHYSVMGIDRTLGEGRTPLSAIRKAHAELVRIIEEAEGLMVPLWATMKRGPRP